MLVGNNLTTIAGYTSRVSELLEMVKQLNDIGNKPFEIVDEAKASPVAVADVCVRESMCEEVSSESVASQ